MLLLLLLLLGWQVISLTSIDISLLKISSVAVAAILCFGKEQYKEDDDFECDLENANSDDEHVQTVIPLRHFLLLVAWHPKK